MDTLLLDNTEWDLVLDSAGNIARASAPYAITQDVSSAVRLFRGELWYDVTKGVPYFDQILGKIPPTPLFTAFVEQAANTVPEVASAKCVITQVDSRTVTGVIEIVDTGGQNLIASL